jgi:hypothetical protein
MFSGPVGEVSHTSIFGRLDNGRQHLVYQMELTADTDVAMVLPLPVLTPAGEDAVRFTSLEGYPEFFLDLEKQFRKLRESRLSMGTQRGAPLAVREVGAYDASFVPSLADFERMDARFRLSDAIWESLPSYGDYGFVVFRLRSGTRLRVHPMAFSFATREKGRVFFPTVHVHDGEVHPWADFDHHLYVQSDVALPSRERWKWWSSGMMQINIMDVSRTAGIVRGDRDCAVRDQTGELQNADTFVCVE